MKGWWPQVYGGALEVCKGVLNFGISCTDQRLKFTCACFGTA